jgi:hypothetical protein
MIKLGIYPWQTAYVSAVLEADEAKVHGLILEAVSAIEQRLLSPVDKGSLEVKAIAVAQSVLMTLRADRVAELSNSAKV